MVGAGGENLMAEVRGSGCQPHNLRRPVRGNRDHVRRRERIDHVQPAGWARARAYRRRNRIGPDRSGAGRDWRFRDAYPDHGRNPSAQPPDPGWQRGYGGWRVRELLAGAGAVFWNVHQQQRGRRRFAQQHAAVPRREPLHLRWGVTVETMFAYDRRCRSGGGCV